MRYVFCAVILEGLLTTTSAAQAIPQIDFALLTASNYDYSLTRVHYGNPYPHYQTQHPPTSVTCVPSNCASASPGDALYFHAREEAWSLHPDGWDVNSSASGSSTVEYTGSGSIVATVDFTGLTNRTVNGGPLIHTGDRSVVRRMLTLKESPFQSNSVLLAPLMLT